MSSPSRQLIVPSVEDEVHRILRDEIRSLHLYPEERLRLEDLARRFGVSLTPVRHALRRLESEGLVVTERRRGASVAPLQIEEIEEIQAVRIGLEGMLARLGAENCTDETVAEMVRHRAQIDAAYGGADLGRYIRSFFAFRDVCYQQANRPRLIKALDDQRARVERYILYLCGDIAAASELREPPNRLLAACRARDGVAAEASTRESLLWLLDRLRAMLSASEMGNGPPAEAR